MAIKTQIPAAMVPRYQYDLFRRFVGWLDSFLNDLWYLSPGNGGTHWEIECDVCKKAKIYAPIWKRLPVGQSVWDPSVEQMALVSHTVDENGWIQHEDGFICKDCLSHVPEEMRQ